MNKALIIGAISAVSFIFDFNSITNLFWNRSQLMLQEPMLRNVSHKTNLTSKEYTERV